MKIWAILVIAALTTIFCAASSATESGGHWYYERYSYYQCGREYHGYKPVWVANKAAEKASNVDNSVTHSYTYNITYGQLPAVQGSTLYGYSYSSVADVYGNTDLGALYNQAIRLAGDLNVAADKANTNAMSLVAQAGRERARVAQILATGQAVAQIKAAEATSSAALANAISQGSTVNSSAKFETSVSGSTNGTNVNVTTGDVNKPVDVSSDTNVTAIFNAKCVSCHKVGKEAGGLKLDDVSKLGVDDVKKILFRITTDNTNLRMPKNADGTHGSLSVEEIAAVYKAATN